MNDSRRIENVERTTVPKHHEVQNSMPDDQEGFVGETRFIERSDGEYNKIRKYPDVWKTQLGGTDFTTIDGKPALEVVLNGRKYRMLFEEVT